MENQFNCEKDKLLMQFDKGINVVLSTSLNDIVTSRTVTIIPFKGALYLTSIKRPSAIKIDQIESNPNIAICFNTSQITGIAHIAGFVADKQNEELANLYKEKLPDSFERFASVPTAVFIKIDISKYKSWQIVADKVEITDIDFDHQTVKKNII